MLSQIDLAATLQAIPWFRDLRPAQIEQLAGITETRQLMRDEILYSEGERADYLYIVLEGRIAVENYVPGRGNVRVFTAEPLDIVGWSNMTPVVRQRESSAHALLPTTLLRFRGEALRQLCDQDHDLGFFIMRRLANVVASRLLSTRLNLLDIITSLQDERKISLPE